MYLGMLIFGWVLGLAAGLVASFVYGAPLWAGFLIWSFGGAAIALLGLVSLHLLPGDQAKERRHSARVGTRAG
ncbi:hypothetical protein OEW28_06210 [Defluviimonas sp. WL0002]|uniref:Major facilitator superfamily (MFS) profile domain-containing protein n=1 Tax=Albidovulum marisflavi TaxID=2984159 RepID=A0ABT2ZAS1_9RHOB|nr:hypothetical protein [Defluviimonas sp. WL0002]MCV2868219.1 hypothetical protein [Defluviimonas sp. WL0002]